MVENADIYRRLEGIEVVVDARLKEVNCQLERLHEILVELAKQKKDIDHLTDNVSRLRMKFEDDVEKRLVSLEKIHASCTLEKVESSIKSIWKVIVAFVFVLLGVAVDRFWVKQ